MEASAGLVAGSHNRNELVVIRRDGESAVSPSFFFSFSSSSFGLSVSTIAISVRCLCCLMSYHRHT
jgi:hypothetical protein